MPRWSWLVALLVTAAAVLQPTVLDASGPSLALVAALVLCTIAFAVAVASAAVPLPHPNLRTSPAYRRVRGRFLQQSRPGVPGRVRARAPGCGR